MRFERGPTRELARFIGTAGYCGYAPFASGTVGTLPAVVLAPGLALLAAYSTALYLLSLLVWLLLALWATRHCLEIFDSGDPGEIVIDEVLGFFVTVAFLPLDLTTLLLGFFLFRFFDVLKPPPARQAESLPGAVGVVADDLIAGLMANLSLRLLMWAWPLLLS